MTALGNIKKGRSPSFITNSTIVEIEALQAAAQVRIEGPFYIESGRNPADAPSRGLPLPGQGPASR